MSDAKKTTSTHPAFAAGEQIAQDIPCIACGYNLRGLEPSRRCPECGQAVSDSVRGDLLRFANPVWLGRLNRGVNLISTAATLLVLLTLFSPFLLIMLDYAFSLSDTVLTVTEYALQLGMLGSLLLLLWGCLMVTAQEPKVILMEKTASARNIARIALLAALAAFACAATLGEPYNRVASTLFIAFALLGLLGCMYGLRQVAARIPDDKQAARLRRRFVELLCCGVVFLVLSGLHLLMQLGVIISSLDSATRTAYQVAGLALGIAILLAVVAISGLRRPLQQLLGDTRAARQNPRRPADG